MRKSRLYILSVYSKTRVLSECMDIDSRLCSLCVEGILHMHFPDTLKTCECICIRSMSWCLFLYSDRTWEFLDPIQPMTSIN